MSINKWRILPLTIADQQQHIDCSEMLLRTIEPWHPATMYWSIAEHEGLVLGFSQKEDALNREGVGQQQIPIYQRRAGGTAVVVGQRKVVGLDMIRRKVGSVLQAGVLLQWETATLAKLLGRTIEEQALLEEGLLERAIGLDRLADHTINAAEVIAAFEQVVLSMNKVG